MPEDNNHQGSFGLAWIRQHPLMVVICIVCWVICLGLAWLYCPDTLSAQRKIAMGSFGGLFCTICLIAGRLFKV
jgi:hypothetical protein